MLTTKDFIEAMARFGALLYEIGTNGTKNSGINAAHHYNGWFTGENVQYALLAFSKSISSQKTAVWLADYAIKQHKPKRIGVILPGNIPFAGLHDLICVLATGNIFVGKTSSKEKKLMPILSDILIDIEPRFKSKIEFSEGKFDHIEAIITAGSNNTSRYMQYYYGKYPNIIRKNRNSAAVLNGNETKEEIKALGRDIFQYFGLGCRNVSKIFLPEGYKLSDFTDGITDYQYVMQNNKYANNYHYHRTVCLMNKYKITDNGFVLLKEDESLLSPVAMLHYEYYKGKKDLVEKINRQEDGIQCIVSNIKINSKKVVYFGKAQEPELSDYADGIDTMDFLINRV